MKIYEYQASALLAAYGIPVPEGRVASTPEEARAAAASIGLPVMVKAQVLVGGRGKAGGVVKASTSEEVERHAARILGMKIKGVAVSKVLIARALEITAEYYLALALDRSSKAVQGIASASGGMDIEEVAVRDPGRIVRFPVDTTGAPPHDQLLPRLAEAFAEASLAEQAWEVLERMHRLLVENDCTLVEINPFARDGAGRLAAADAKIVLDDNALFKHPELEKLRASEEYSAEELEARANGLAFVGLEGTVGCIVNGAGLAMATMDLIKQAGGRPANFLDVGGSSSPEKVLAALRILLGRTGLRAILVNIFGGITRCDDIARGILMARGELSIPFPMIIRLIGTNDVEGRRLLAEAGIEAYEDLSEAVRAAVRAATKAPVRAAERPALQSPATDPTARSGNDA